MARIDDFQKDAAGNIVTRPLVGWTTMPVGGMALIAKLDYVTSDQMLRAGKSESVQLILTPAQCRELAALLLRMADHLSQPPQSGVPQ
jgi:hypothetical protein